VSPAVVTDGRRRHGDYRDQPGAACRAVDPRRPTPAPTRAPTTQPGPLR